MTDLTKTFVFIIALATSQGLAGHLPAQTAPEVVNGQIVDEREDLAHCETDQTCQYADDLAGETIDMAFPTSIDHQITD